MEIGVCTWYQRLTPAWVSVLRSMTCSSVGMCAFKACRQHSTRQTPPMSAFAFRGGRGRGRRMGEEEHGESEEEGGSEVE
eukprot:2506581-Rhodomonas_salina.6